MMTLMRMMKRVLRALLTRSLRAVDYVVPKDQSLVILGTNHQGNTKAIYDYIRSHDCGLQAYRYDTTSRENQEDPNQITSLYSLGSLWKILRAKTIISTHGAFLQLSRRKLYVETWHGVPLKGQIFTEARPDARRLRPRYYRHWTKYVDIFIAPSKEAAYRMSASCMLNPLKIFYCGQARNDVLYQKQDIIKVRESLGVPEFTKLILYCPTFRDNECTRFFPFVDMDHNDFNNFLDEQNAIILLRGHQNACQITGDTNSSRIRFCGQGIWPDVNELLPHIDLLVTDYSSIYYDYLILDRPIVFVPYDIERYEKERGFVVDDYNWWTPGDKVFNYIAFKTSIREGLTNPDAYRKERQTINNLVNYYQDGNSCSRIVEMIKSRVGEVVYVRVIGNCAE